MKLLSGENKLEIFMILLFQICFGIKFNFIGTISLSEILIVLYFATHYFHDSIRQEPELKHLERCYFALIFVQILMEFLSGNSFDNAVRGFSITIVSLCHFYFLLKVFYKKLYLVIWALIGTVLKALLFSEFKDGRIIDALLGNNSTYMKFILAPLLVYVALLLLFQLKNKTASYLFILLGLFIVICGARSSGVMCVLTGIISLVISNGLEINIRSLVKPVCIISVFGYMLYCVYVSQVLSGGISAGNNEQIKKVENPYNPMYLLMAGRAEVFVGWIAFTDNPITGWGSWKKDSDLGNKYHKIQSSLGGEIIERKDYNEDNLGSDLIPCHSVIISYACNNGIFALALIVMILFSCLKYGIRSWSSNEEYRLILVYLIIFMCWNMIFSPQSHFRQTLPLSMAFMLVCYWNMKEEEEENEEENVELDNELLIEKKHYE